MTDATAPSPAAVRQAVASTASTRWGWIAGGCVVVAGAAWLAWSGREPGRPADVVARAPDPAAPAAPAPSRAERPAAPARTPPPPTATEQTTAPAPSVTLPAPTPFADTPTPWPSARAPAPTPSTTTPTLSTTTPTPTPSPAAAEADPDASMARELARALDAAGAAVDVRVARDADDLLAAAAPGAPPRLLIARYDALRSARASAGGTTAPLQVIAPLYTEETQFFVRADSALHFIHEIKGRDINVGPADASRAATIGALYQRLFGAAPKASPASALPQAAALARMLDDGAPADARVEVVALVGGQPLASLAGLAPQAQGRLRLLALDPSHPASQRALRTFLPATLRAGVGSTGAPAPTLSEMAFLVAPAPVDAALAGRWAEALCRGLGSLRRDGHAKWAEVQPGLVLDAGWPQSAPAQRALEACRPAARTPN